MNELFERLPTRQHSWPGGMIVWGFILSGVSFLSTAPSNHALAQEIALEEIVVTARQRSESIQDIPIAITAFSGSEIARRNIQNMSEIALYTPGFNFENLGGTGNTRPVIRGATKIAGDIEDNVSFFFDGVYLSRSYVTDLGFANIERVEVVKGPQSARYGRNAFMGAVNYITKKPTEELMAEGSLKIGNYGRYDASASVSGAVVPDVLSVRVSANYSQFDGSWRNTHPFSDIDFNLGTDDRVGGWEKTALSGAIRLTPTESLTIDASYQYFEDNKEHSPQNWFGELNADSELMNCGQFNPDVRPAGSGLGGGGEWFRLFCGELPVRNIPIDPRGYAQQLDMDFYRATVNWEISDDFTFDYIYGRAEAKTFAHGYKDTLPGCTFLFGICIFESGPIGDFSSNSHDVRVSYDNDGPLTASVGVYYTDFTDFVTTNVTGLFNLSAVPTQAVDVREPNDFVFLSPTRRKISESEAWSVFGEITYSFSEDRARFGVEARYTSEEKTDKQLPITGDLGLGDFVESQLSDTFKSFTPRFTLEYDVTDESLLFASVAKGVKAGGFNIGATLPENRTFNEDRNWTYEIGTKNTFLDGAAQLNASLFYVDWSDVQISAADPGNPNPLPIGITRNVGNVTSKGIEVDGAIAATDKLSFYGTLYYGDASYKQGTVNLSLGRTPAICDDVVCNTNGDIGGNQLERQSKWQGSLGAEWSDNLPGDMDLEYYLRSDVGYQSKMYAQALNIAWVPSRTVANASAGLVGEWFDVQLWVRNLFDEKYVANVVVQQPNVAYNAYLGERQTFGLTFNLSY